MAGQLAETSLLIHVKTDGTADVARTAEEINKLKASLQGASTSIGATGQAAGAASGKIAGLASTAQGLRGAFSGAQAGVGGLLGSLSGLEGMGGLLLPITAGVIGLGLAFKGIGAGIEAASEAENSLVRLDAAVKRTGASVETEAPQIEAAIQKVFATSAFDDEPLRRAAASFVTITGDAKLAAQAISPIADLAAAMGIDVESAANLVAKATQGMTGQLQRAGIIFTEDEQSALKMASAGERAAIVFDRINRAVGGAAATDLSTYSGQVANMKKQWDELAQKFGGLFLPTATKVVTALAKMAEGGAKLLAILEKLQSVGIIGGDWALLDKLLERGKAERPADANLDTLKPAAAVVPPPLKLDLSAAYAKAKADALTTTQQIASMFEDLGKEAFEVEIAFRVPQTDPVLKAVQDVNDKARQLLDRSRDKAMALGQDLARNLAQLTVLELQYRDATKDPKTQRSEDVVAIQAQINAIKQLISGEKSALDFERQMPDAINKGADAFAQMAADDAMVAKLLEIRAQFEEIDNQVDELTEKSKHALEGMLLPDDIATNLKAELDAVGREEQAKLSFALAFSGGDLQGFSQVMSQGAKDVGDRARAGIEGGADRFAQVITNAFQVGTDRIVQGITDGFSTVTGDEFRNKVAELLKGLGIKPDTAAFTAAMSQASQRFSQALQEAFDAAVGRLASNLSSIFTDLAQTGGANFGKIGAKIFEDNLSKNLTQLFGQAIVGALGGPVERKPGETDQAFQDRKDLSNEQNAKLAGAINATIGGIGQIVNQLQAAKQGQKTSVFGSVLGGAVTGAGIGAVFGNALGAVIGAIVGALIGGITAAVANAKAKKSWPVADYGIEGGQAYVRPGPGKYAENFQNVTDSMKSDMVHAMQTALSETSSAYVNLLLKLPIDVIAGLRIGMAGMNFTNLGADFFNEKDRQNFLADFDNWVKNQLPTDIAQHFRAAVSTGFTAMGMTVDRFNELWDSLQGIDPKDAAQILSDSLDALIAFDKWAQFVKNLPRNFAIGLAQGKPLDQTGTVQGRGVNEFQQMMIDAGEQLQKLGLAILDLPLKEQAAAAAQLGQRLDVLRGNLQEFLNGLIETSQELSRSIDEMRFGIKVDQAKTPQDKSDLLYGQLQYVETQIRNASSLGLNAADVQRLTQNAMDLIQKLYQQDPTNRASWADQQLAYLDQLQQAAVKQLGDAAIKLFQQIADGLQPTIDLFEGKIPDSMTGLATAADAAAEALAKIPTAMWGQHQPGTATNPDGTPLGSPPTGPPIHTEPGDHDYGPGGGNRGYGPNWSEQHPDAAQQPPVAPAATDHYTPPVPQYAQGPTRGPSGPGYESFEPWQGGAPTDQSGPHKWDETVWAGPGGVAHFGGLPPTGPATTPTSPADLEKVVALLTDMDALMPAPEVFVGMFDDLEKLVAAANLLGGAPAPEQPITLAPRPAPSLEQTPPQPTRQASDLDYWRGIFQQFEATHPTQAAGGGSTAPSQEADLVIQQSIAEIAKAYTDGEVRTEAKLDEVLAALQTSAGAASSDSSTLAGLLEQIRAGQERIASALESVNAIISTGRELNVRIDPLEIQFEDSTIQAQATVSEDRFPTRVVQTRGRLA